MRQVAIALATLAGLFLAQPNAVAGSANAFLTGDSSANVGEFAQFTLSVTYSPDPGYSYEPTGQISGTIYFGDGSSIPIFAEFNTNSPSMDMFSHAYLSPGMYEVYATGTANVFEQTGPEDGHEDDPMFSADTFISVDAVSPPPPTPQGAPAPLAGAGLLSFFGAGGLAMRKRAKRVIASLFAGRVSAAA